MEESQETKIVSVLPSPHKSRVTAYEQNILRGGGDVVTYRILTDAVVLFEFLLCKQVHL